MQADGFFPLIPTHAGTGGSNEQVFHRGAEYGDALCRDNVAGTRVAASSRNGFKEARGDCDGVFTGDAAEGDRAPAVASDTDAKRRSAIRRFSAQAYIGGDAVKIERSAAVDRQRDFGGKTLRE